MWRGRRRFRTKQKLVDLRQKAEQTGRLQHDAAQGIGHQHIALTHRIQQSGHAQGRVGAQLQRVAEVADDVAVEVELVQVVAAVVQAIEPATVGQLRLDQVAEFVVVV